MEETGKKNKLFLTQEAPFLNSDGLLVEYFDVIKSPLFIFLLMIKEDNAITNTVFDEVFDMSAIKEYSTEELYAWYITRKHQNVFYSIPVKDEAFENKFQNDPKKFFDWADSYTMGIIEEVPEIVSGFPLNFLSVILNLKMDPKILKRLLIYVPWESETIYEDACLLFGDTAEFVYGDFYDVLTNEEIGITNNFTFVFSDAKKIFDLHRARKLDRSSILIADRYGYNYSEENPEELRYNIDALYTNDCLFKLNFFENLFI